MAKHLPFSAQDIIHYALIPANQLRGHIPSCVCTVCIESFFLHFILKVFFFLQSCVCLRETILANSTARAGEKQKQNAPSVDKKKKKTVLSESSPKVNVRAFA